MSVAFKPAVRENVNLLLGVAGPSGGGKTFSAMRMAHGICGDKPFAVIDTEAGRASHYAGRFRFDVAELRAPFRPEAYADAIAAADAAGYPVIIVDSMSHEHAGDGGLLDWHEEEVARMAGDDWKKREAVNMVAWAKVKQAHKRMMQRLLQVRGHLILCFRAEEKIEIVKRDGKVQIVPKQSLTGLDGWIPIAEKTLPFELTASFMLTPDAPGMPKPIKLQEDHKSIFPLDRPLDEASGKRIAEWATGGVPRATDTPAVGSAGAADPSARPARTERHDHMVADFEVLARERGFEEFKAAWKKLAPEDRAAIGNAERDRIGTIGTAHDQRNEETL